MVRAGCTPRTTCREAWSYVPPDSRQSRTTSARAKTARFVACVYGLGREAAAVTWHVPVLWSGGDGVVRQSVRAWARNRGLDRPLHVPVRVSWSLGFAP